MVNNKFLKLKSTELEKKYNLEHYEVLQRFMFERILERISVSKYQDDFILKGGLLLSAIFGVDKRTTKDMDTTIKGIDISKDNMIKVLNEILSIKLNDGVKFDIVSTTDIIQDDKYGRNKYHIVGKTVDTKINLEIDISTGDIITPKELKYKYPLLFEDRSIMITSYNLETILAQKIETVIKRGKYNSRMKDFYDIYFFITKLIKDIDLTIFKQALIVTCEQRKTLNYLNDYKEIIDSIKNYKRIYSIWSAFSKRNTYANNISLGEVLCLN